MIGYSSFHMYFDEDILPPEQALIFTENVEKVRLMIHFLLDAKPKKGSPRMFSTVTMKFSTVGKGIFGEFVLVLFYSYKKNPTG